jgi:antitoxin ParD1/3/4
MPAHHAKSIALTPELDRLVDELVASGEYKSASEVMRDGLRALLERRERNAAELAEIRMRIAIGLKEAGRGEFADGTGEEAIHRAFDIGTARPGA